MKVSVIIPTYNRSKFIIHTLNSFIKQDIGSNLYEIIICDNNSIDDTEFIINDFIKANHSHNIFYIQEKRQGVHFARNTASKIANGEFLYFTDDDMIANENTLSELLKLFSIDSNIACATGIVNPIWLTNPPNWILKWCTNSFLSLFHPDYDLLIANYDMGVFSCHMMVKREIFKLSGGFNPENTKGVWLGDGETGLNIKIKKLGHKFAFSKNSEIRHMIPESRLTQKYLNNRLQNQGNCDSYTQYKEDRSKKLKLLIQNIYFVLKIIKSFAAFLFNLFRFNSYWRVRLAYIYYYKARIIYNNRLVNSSEWREIVLKSNWLNE